MKGPRGRTECFGTWFTDAEARTIRRAAGRAGVDPSEWIRRRVLASTGNRPPLTVSEADVTEAPVDLLAKLRAELGVNTGIVPPMDRYELAARMATVMPHDLGGRGHPEHDRDRCPDCLSLRVQKLVRRGLRPQLAREIRDAGTMAAAYVALLEGASVDELNAVNAAHVRASHSVDRLVTRVDDGQNTPTA